MISVLVFAGPTAVGKTAYAVDAARRFDGEIVSADSMQIYRGFDIGSAKPGAEERGGIPHHLIDFADPAREFSAAEYQKQARAAVTEIAARGKIPILAGGTGLYVNAVLYDMDFSALPRQDAFRRKCTLEAEERGAGFLHDRLRALDGPAAERIHPNNVRKVIRALEILENQETGRGLRAFSEAFRPWPSCAPRIIGLTRDREQLYDRIDRRVDGMMAAGLAAEVAALMARGLSEAHMSMKGIGYKELLAHFHGEYDLDSAVRLIKRNSRRYAKRQLTWFRRYADIKWFNLSGLEGAAGGKDAALREIFDYISSVQDGV